GEAVRWEWQRNSPECRAGARGPARAHRRSSSPQAWHQFFGVAHRELRAPSWGQGRRWPLPVSGMDRRSGHLGRGADAFASSRAQLLNADRTDARQPDALDGDVDAAANSDGLLAEWVAARDAAKGA